MKGREDHLPVLDGLRALAILLVIWCHLTVFGYTNHFATGPAWLDTAGAFGSSGVPLFFVLSGFLLFLPYARALLMQTPWPSARRFYLRRVLRILPGYYAALFLLLWLQNGFSFRGVPPVPLLLSALLLQDWSLHAFLFSSAIDVPFWTLTVEWQFYLVLPLLALYLAKIGGPRTGARFWQRLLLGFLSLILVGLAIRVLVAYLHYGAGIAYPSDAPDVIDWLLRATYGIQGRGLEGFALGMVSSVAYVWLQIHPDVLPQRQRLGTIALFVGSAGLALMVLYLSLTGQMPPAWPSGQWLFPAVIAPSIAWSGFVVCACYCAILLSLLVHQGWLFHVLTLRPVRFIGTISYSLYLWHFPLLGFVIRFFPPISARLSALYRDLAASAFPCMRALLSLY